MTSRQYITGATAAAALAGLAVVYNFAPARYSFYPRLPFLCRDPLALSRLRRHPGFVLSVARGLVGSTAL